MPQAFVTALVKVHSAGDSATGSKRNIFTGKHPPIRFGRAARAEGADRCLFVEADPLAVAADELLERAAAFEHALAPDALGGDAQPVPRAAALPRGGARLGSSAKHGAHGVWRQGVPGEGSDV